MKDIEHFTDQGHTHLVCSVCNEDLGIQMNLKDWPTLADVHMKKYPDHKVFGDVWISSS